MTLRERLKDDTTAAMRSGDALRRDVLRMVQSSIYNAEKAKLAPLTDDEVDAILAREIKQRRESVDAFRQGQRDDLAEKEEAELRILTEYMPQLSAPQLEALVADAIRETGATSPRDMRAVMDWLRPHTSGRADSKAVAGLVAQALARENLATHEVGH